MAGAYLVVAGVVFITGVLAGIFMLVIVGIHREDRGRGMPTEAPGKAARGARVVTGMHVLPRGTYEAVQYRHRQPPVDREW